MKLLFKMKSNAALDQAEDPREVFDYAYRRQQEFLRTVKRGLIEVSTTRHQLEGQVNRQRARIPFLEDQAGQAVATDREDLARIFLQRKRTVIAELAGLEDQLAEVTEEERRLVFAGQQLENQIADFRTRREVASARYTAAEAQVRINEMLSGFHEEIGELSMALGRAEDKTQRMITRASAIETLIEHGSLATPLLSGDIAEEALNKAVIDKKIEAELKALKMERSPEQLLTDTVSGQ